MVFEAIVVDVLNKVLGEYVENLDTSQLKIGIWGGDVVLKDLTLKQTALNDLNLPVKVTWGQLGKLVLKIPWKNLYSAPVVVNVEDLFVLVSPESEIIYVPEREEKWEQEAKQAELQRVEEAKKRAAEKDAVKTDDTFVEKLMTQVIKNVQVRIERIHIRYEDRNTRRTSVAGEAPQGAFCVGATINQLAVHTTDENGEPCFATDSVVFIYKALMLDGLALYWNPNGELFSELTPSGQLDRFRSDIPTAESQPPGYSYLFGPMSSSAKLVMNPKPELDGTNYTTPKLELNIEMDEFTVALTRRQFQDMMILIENMDRLSKGRAYRKYRPNINSYRGHYREWWAFAVQCVLVDVRRRRDGWNWQHMLVHRQRCRDYQKCYTRVLSAKPPPEAVEEARELEKEIDVFNLILMRQRASVEAQRLARAEEEARASRGWFSGWFSAQPTAEEQFSADIVKKIETAMTADEKSKLYEAIGYQENAVPAQYPSSFVATRLSFVLTAARVRVLDENLLVMLAELNDLRAQLDQRPAASALRARVSFGEFSVVGVKQSVGVAQLVASRCHGKERLVDAVYETNPIDGRCDQRIHVTARPLKIIYNHETVTRLQDIFTSADASGISQVKARTTASLPTFKQMSAMGLQFAVERRSRLDLQIHVSASTLLVPHYGVYLSERAMLVVKLGQLSVETEEQKTISDVSVRKLFLQGSTEEEIFSSILSESYTKFNCRLTGIQVLMRMEKEDWESSLKQVEPTSLHLLQPTDLQVVVKKSLVTEDARIPKMVVEGVLPSVCVHVSEERILALVALLASMPQTESPSKPESQSRSSSTWSLASLSNHLDQKRRETPNLNQEPTETSALVQGTNLTCHFQMNELVVHVNKVSGWFLRLAAVQLAVDFVQKTLDTSMGVKLSGVAMTQLHGGLEIPLVASSGDSKDQCLASLNVIMCERNSPEFFTTKGGVLTSVKLTVSQSNVVLHQEALMALMDFANTLSAQMEQVKKEQGGHEAVEGVEVPLSADTKALRRKLSQILEDDVPRQKKVVKPRRSGKTARVEVIDLKADVVVERVRVEMRGATPIARLSVDGIRLGVVSKRSCTGYAIALQGLQVQDLDPATAYAMVVHSSAAETVHVDISIYNKELALPEHDVDMRVEASLGQLRVVYLQRFLTQLVDFGNSFQTAKEAVLEASAAAAERAKQNMMKAYDEATRVALKVHIEAPLIVVPRNRTSTDALVIDLGVVNIDNSFTNLEPVAEGVPVLDTMRLNLHELKLSRAAVNPTDLDVIVEHPLLDPVTFDLVVNRNLSVSWYRQVADLDLFSRLGSIQLALDHMDYAFILAMLQENMSEGGKQGQEVTPAIEGTGTDREASAGAPAVNTAVMFTFSMDSFIVSLHPGGYPELTPDIRPKKRKHGLARFVLQTLALKGKMFSDGSIYTSIRLVDCILEDTRQGKSGRLTTLMERKREEEASKSMIDITYQQKGSQKFIDMRVFSFILVISVDFLMKIAGFFSVENASEAVKRGKGGRKLKGAPKPMETPPVPPPDETLTLDLRIEKPDIVLVENIDDVDTDALIFHTEVVLKYRTVGCKQIINGTLNDLQLYTCCFNPKRRKATMKQVVKPVTVSLTGSTPEGQGLHLDLHCTAIAIAVCPASIQLVNQCYAALNTSQDASDQEKEEVDWSNVWGHKSFQEQDYWFLEPDEALEALEALSSEVAVSPSGLQELCIIDVPSVLVTVEAGIGNRTVPMILLEMGLTSQAKNWSSGLQMDATLSLGMQYYNRNLAAWEPLIEPVETPKGRQRLFQPWQISCQVSMNKVEEEQALLDDITPGMTVTLTARDPLEVTVTKTCLDVLSQLGEAFANAVSAAPSPTPSTVPGGGASYIVCNDTGVSALLLLATSQLQVGGEQVQDVTLDAGDQVELRLPLNVVAAAPGRISYTPSSPTHALPGFFLALKLPSLGAGTLTVPLDCASKRLYPMQAPPGTPTQAGPWSIVVEVTAGSAFTTVTLRSAVQIHNHFSVSIDVHYMTNRGNEVELVGSVEPNGTLNLPPYAIYTRTGELFFSIEGYSLSIVPFIWKELQNEINVAVQLQCEPKRKEDVDPFFIKAVGELEQVYWEHSTRHTLASMCYNIHLQPTVELINGLPAAVTLAAQGNVGEVYIRPGAKAHVPHADPGSSSITLRISDYLEKEWSCRVNIPASPSEFSVWSFESFDSAAPVTLNLGVHYTSSRGTFCFTLYCPFWMINKTGQQLSYKLEEGSPVMYHPATFLDPIMLSPSSRKFLGKKKGQVKVGTGEWSEKFSLDVAGSSGLVECRDSTGKIVMLSVRIQLTHSGLTKMIVFTPAHVVVNKTQTILEVQEENAEEWMPVPIDGCAPFWPTRPHHDSRLVVRVLGTTELTPLLHFHSTHSCLLKLQNKYGGVFADVQNTAGGIYINLHSYEPGLAPALLLNHTDKPAMFHEKSTDFKVVLAPGQSLLYAWQRPDGPRTLLWTVGGKDIPFSLNEDVAGEVLKEVWYVSFLDGPQRVVLLTCEARVALAVQAAGALEKPLSEISLHLYGLGVSLVNNRPPHSMELLYMGLVSSGVTWETRKLGARRFKPISARESGLIERAYNNFTDCEASSRSSDPLIVIDNKLQVNLETLELIAPHRRQLRRSFQPGLWISVTQTEHSLMLHGKVNRLQLDNQTPAAIFPVILAPVPPPKTVAAGQGPKPFVELSILKRVTAHSTVQQYKYFKVLVQEFHVKLDVGFVHALLSFLAADDTSQSVARQHFLADIELSQQPLLAHIAVISSQEQKDFYDLLHFSPLKIHLSFSMAGNVESRSLPAAFSLLLQSLGVTLTDIQDAVFRLSYLERKNIFLTRSQLIGEATTHYSGQALRQVYVLLLGLDVIGNPYGLVTGIGEGVEALFYEPFQGIIQGPAEFAEGLGLGVRSLFGHTVGGAAGAFGRITGTLGKGLAALSMDKEYQQQRLEQQNRRPDNFQASMAQGGKGLVMGVFQGVTGVVTKPIAGAKEEGVGGFFKGMGKGMMGLVTRPVSGVVDFASTSLHAVKRATEHGTEASRLRPPRLMRGLGVEPYKAYDAAGGALLGELDGRKYASTDEYQYHVELPNKDVLILTDKRFIIATMSDVFGTWQVNLSVRWSELASEPATHPKGVVVALAKGKSSSVFGQNRETKLIPMPHVAEQQFLVEKMGELYALEMSNNR